MRENDAALELCKQLQFTVDNISGAYVISRLCTSLELPVMLKLAIENNSNVYMFGDGGKYWVYFVTCNEILDGNIAGALAGYDG